MGIAEADARKLWALARDRLDANVGNLRAVEANVGHVGTVFSDCLDAEVGDVLAEIQVKLGHRARLGDRRNADVADCRMAEANGGQVGTVGSERLRAGVWLGRCGVMVTEE